MTAKDQASDPLEWARHVRSVRASLCAALGRGEATFDEVVAIRDDPAVATIHVSSLLESLPGARKIDVRRALLAASLDERLELGAAGEGELEALSAIASAGASRTGDGR